MSIKQRDQKVAGPEQTGPQWPSEDARRLAVSTNANGYRHHIGRGRDHSDKAIACQQKIDVLRAQIGQLEQERDHEAQLARVEHEAGSAYAEFLKWAGEPLPVIEVQQSAQQHAEQYGGPQTGVFALPGDLVCPCGAPMVHDQTLGPIHRFQDGGYELAGEVCRRLKSQQEAAS